MATDDRSTFRPHLSRVFANRTEAGKELAERLSTFKNENPVVLGLPRGGVTVAVEIAHALHAPLDVLLVRKIGAPMNPELALGAVVDGPHPITVWNHDVMVGMHIPEGFLEKETQRQLGLIEQRRQRYGAARNIVDPKGKTVIVVDDGVATGATARAALTALKAAEPKQLIFAVPVGPTDTLDVLATLVDEVVCISEPRPFGAVGYFYRDFGEVTDQQVTEMLAEHPFNP